ncbi:MAG: TIGR02147 family protein [Bdellovibrio sp.]|nr:TIGR02147 family protein [Bdellovibrio sp.]
MSHSNLTSQQILARELEIRIQRNPRYSLRQFAKSLGMSHTVLSLVLSGKRPLSTNAAIKITEKLALSPEEVQVLMNSHPKKQIQKKIESYTSVDLETFELISNWIHYAILSLFETADAVFDHVWVANRLNISKADAKDALARLVKLELLAETNGRWRQTGKSIKVENTISTAFTRNFHRQLLDKALHSLDNDPIETRNFSSMTMAIDPKHMDYAIERIRDFRRQLTAELEAKGAPQEVYNLTVQMYPVSSRGSL